MRRQRTHIPPPPRTSLLDQSGYWSSPHTPPLTSATTALQGVESGRETLPPPEKKRQSNKLPAHLPNVSAKTKKPPHYARFPTFIAPKSVAQKQKAPCAPGEHNHASQETNACRERWPSPQPPCQGASTSSICPLLQQPTNILGRPPNSLARSCLRKQDGALMTPVMGAGLCNTAHHYMEIPQVQCRKQATHTHTHTPGGEGVPVQSQNRLRSS